VRYTGLGKCGRGSAAALRIKMKRYFLLLGACLVVQSVSQGHDIITTPITWSREISRIVFKHCASCHHPDGKAFSLLTYNEARPWAVAIKEEILTRRMPPWGAIKGFADFRNDQSLTPEQMELIVSWADGGVPEGEDKDLPPKLKDGENAFPSDPSKAVLKTAVTVSGEFKLTRALTIDGVWPKTVVDHTTSQIVAETPDGDLRPLVWLSDYRPRTGHEFLYRTPVKLPAGTVIHGVPADAAVMLLAPQAPSSASAATSRPVTSTPQQARQSGPYSPRPSAGIVPKPGTSAPAEK
jgi:hypothetical protein